VSTQAQRLDELAGYAEYPGWTHLAQQYHPAGRLSLPGAHLKWYDIRGAEQDATPEVSDEARAFLRAEEAAGRLAFREELGFVLLHRCGERYILIAGVWRDRNELVQVIYLRDDAGFQPYQHEPGLQQATQDVDEFVVTCHESRAWLTYLRSDRDAAAKPADLDDVAPGGPR
jgi:hypothetical protein